MIWLFVLLFAAGCQARQQTSVTIEPKPFVVYPVEVVERNPYASSFAVERLPDTQVPKVGSVASFKFVARGFVPNSRITLANQSLGGPIKPICEFQVDDDGTLGRQVPEGTMILDNDVWLMFDFLRGEPIRYWLISADNKTRLSQLFVPYPLRTKGRDGAEVSLRRLVPDASLVLCEGDGFLPDEEVFVTSTSADKMIAQVPIVCAYGKFSMAFEPKRAGKTGGVSVIEIKRQYERLLLEYDWGSEAVSKKKVIASPNNMNSDTLQKLSSES